VGERSISTEELLEKDVKELIAQIAVVE
jgi:hypothetical protein